MLLAPVVARLVLGRDDDRGRLGRLAVLEAQRDLALGVGLEERRGPGMAVRGHLHQDLVAVIERRRHEVRRLVAGEAEHDALVARAFVLVARRHRRPARSAPTAGGGDWRVEPVPVDPVLLIADPRTTPRTASSIYARPAQARCPAPSSRRPAGLPIRGRPRPHPLVLARLAARSRTSIAAMSPRSSWFVGVTPPGR